MFDFLEWVHLDDKFQLNRKMVNIGRADMDGRWPNQKEGELQDNISEQTIPPPPSYAEISFQVPKQVSLVWLVLISTWLDDDM